MQIIGTAFSRPVALPCQARFGAGCAMPTFRAGRPTAPAHGRTRFETPSRSPRGRRRRLEHARREVEARAIRLFFESEEGFISLFLRDSVRKTGTTLLELLQQYWDLAGAFPRTAPHRATGNDVTQPTSHDPDRVLLASTRRPRNRLGKRCLNGHIDWLCRGRARGCRSARSFD